MFCRCCSVVKSRLTLFATPWIAACHAPLPTRSPGKNTGVGAIISSRGSLQPLADPKSSLGVKRKCYCSVYKCHYFVSATNSVSYYEKFHPCDYTQNHTVSSTCCCQELSPLPVIGAGSVTAHGLWHTPAVDTPQHRLSRLKN